MRMLKLVGDLETTTKENDLRVWNCCLVNIEDNNIMLLDNNIDSIFDFLSTRNSKVYFHNLKFDAQFLIYYLLTHGFVHSDSKQENTFSTLITDTGVFYAITVYFKVMKKRYLKVTFHDSLKKLPFKVSNIAKAFNLKESKGEIDYKMDRPAGYIPSILENHYIITDCRIVSKALNIQFENGLTAMTIASDALSTFKKMITKQRFENWFPILPLYVDEDIRRSYKGGFTWLNPKYKNKIVSGLVFDVNSMYPAVMRNDILPYGYPIFYEGQYKPDDFFPVFIQRIRCEFKIKKNHIPSIQLKGNDAFIPTNYLLHSNGEIHELTLTSIDLDLFLQQYNVYNLEYVWGWKFKGCDGMFNQYIDHWNDIKVKSTGANRTIAKLMLNSLYGKFASNPKSITKSPYLSDESIVKYSLNEPTMKDSIYTAVSSFITAYARKKTILTAQALYNRFIYADTDSIHLEGYEMPDIDIHPHRLGAWKHESTFTQGKFLRAKTYIETIDDEDHIKCAGMPDNIKENVTYDNFTYGSKFNGKLIPKSYKGGVILQDTDFTISM